VIQRDIITSIKFSAAIAGICPEDSYVSNCRVGVRTDSPARAWQCMCGTSPNCVTYLRSVRLGNLLDHNLWLRLGRRRSCHRRRYCCRGCCCGTHRRRCWSWCWCCRLLDRCGRRLHCQIYLCRAQHTLLSRRCLRYKTDLFPTLY
jgi:hypothetical protein